MQINQVIETPEGSVKFEGELSPEETTAVIRAGLNWLLQAGALPILVEGEGLAYRTDLHIPEDTVEQ